MMHRRATDIEMLDRQLDYCPEKIGPHGAVVP